MDDDSTASTETGTTTRRRVLTLASGGICASLAGCATDSGQSTPRRPEATVTIRLRNRDRQPRKFEVVVNQGESLTDSFSGVLPADQSEPIEMVATFRATDEQHDFSIVTSGGQRGRTWDPTACGDFLVEAFVEGAAPGFESECRAE